MGNLEVKTQARRPEGAIMKIEMTSKIIDITPAIRERIESRFEKLERLQVPLITPHVIISKERLMYIVEATIGIPNGKLFAQAEHEDLYAAITDLGQKLERQLNRHTENPSPVVPPAGSAPTGRSRRLTRFTTHKAKAGYPAFCILPCRHPSQRSLASTPAQAHRAAAASSAEPPPWSQRP